MDSRYSQSSRPAGTRPNAGYARGQSGETGYSDSGRMLRGPAPSPTTEGPRRTTRASNKSQVSTSAVQAAMAVDSTHSTEDADNSGSTGSKGQFPDWILKAHTLDDDDLIARLVEASEHEGSKYYDALVKKDQASLIDYGQLPRSVGTKDLKKRFSLRSQTGYEPYEHELIVVNRVSGKHIPVNPKSDHITCYDSVWKPIMEAVTNATNGSMGRNVQVKYQSAIKSVIHALAMSFGPLQMGTDNITEITTYLLRDSPWQVWNSLGLGDTDVYDYRTRG